MFAPLFESFARNLDGIRTAVVQTVVSYPKGRKGLFLCQDKEEGREIVRSDEERLSGELRTY